MAGFHAMFNTFCFSLSVTISVKWCHAKCSPLGGGGGGDRVGVSFGAGGSFVHYSHFVPWRM